jgi:hypothetical protein
VGTKATFPRLAAVVALAAVTLGCAFEQADGNQVAGDAVEAAADQLDARLGRPSHAGRAEDIAATRVHGWRPELVTVTTLAWSGRTAGAEQATIDVRFSAMVETDQIGGWGNTAGSATRCYRFTLELYRDTTHQEIDCPDPASPPPVPEASPPPALPPGAADRLAAALRDATPATLAQVVRAAFPQQYITVDTATAGDTLVAAVGVPAELDCVVVIRTRAGEPQQVSFDPDQIRPGETGCTTRLYTNPPR